MQNHPVYILKLRCNGIERTVFLEYGIERITRDTVLNLRDLCRYIVKNFGAKRHRLTYIGNNDRAAYILDEESLYNAVRNSCQRVLYVKVTPVEMLTGSEGRNSAVQLGKAKRKFLTSKLPGPALLARRFSIHHVRCSECKVYPIRGARYMYKSDTRRNVCQDCIKEHDKTEWFSIQFPWKTLVPKTPLRSDLTKVRDSVRHLQKALTEMGFLHIKHTKDVQGVYDVHTQKAVESFRNCYGIKGGDMRVYDNSTKTMLAEVLRLKQM